MSSSSSSTTITSRVASPSPLQLYHATDKDWDYFDGFYVNEDAIFDNTGLQGNVTKQEFSDAVLQFQRESSSNFAAFESYERELIRDQLQLNKGLEPWGFIFEPPVENAQRWIGEEHIGNAYEAKKRLHSIK